MLLALLTTLGAAVGCGDNSEEDKVLDAVIVSTDALYDAIGEDGTWETTVDEGAEIAGTLEMDGGSLTASGWRAGAEHTSETAYHQTYSERLTLKFNNWSAVGLIVNGDVVLTRHSLDVGSASGNAVSDVSRTTVYRGLVTVTGEVDGNFDMDVHGLAAGTLIWTCGTMNGEAYGQGSCY